VYKTRSKGRRRKIKTINMNNNGLMKTRRMNTKVEMSTRTKKTKKRNTKTNMSNNSTMRRRRRKRGTMVDGIRGDEDEEYEH
jgi:hypothetical protein